MIEFALMINHSPNNKIDKELTYTQTLQGTLKDATSIVNPVILVELTSPVLNVNYARINAFGRYYYVTDIIQIRTDLWEIHMHCDVLKSFSEGILGSPAIVAKSSSNWNLYLNDTNYRCFQDPLIKQTEFPNGFDLSEMSFVLACVGVAEPVS